MLIFSILVPLLFIIISLMPFYLSKLLFSGFLQVKVTLYVAKITQNTVTELLKLLYSPYLSEVRIILSVLQFVNPFFRYIIRLFIADLHLTQQTLRGEPLGTNACLEEAFTGLLIEKGQIRENTRNAKENATKACGQP